MLPVLPLVEDEFFRSPLILLTVAMYFRPGTRSVKVNSLASLGSNLWMSKRSLSISEMMYFSHSAAGVCHMTPSEVSLACLTRSWRTARGTGEKAMDIRVIDQLGYTPVFLRDLFSSIHRSVLVEHFSSECFWAFREKKLITKKRCSCNITRNKDSKEYSWKILYWVIYFWSLSSRY